MIYLATQRLFVHIYSSHISTEPASFAATVGLPTIVHFVTKMLDHQISFV